MVVRSVVSPTSNESPSSLKLCIAPYSMALRESASRIIVIFEFRLSWTCTVSSSSPFPLPASNV